MIYTLLLMSVLLIIRSMIDPLEMNGNPSVLCPSYGSDHIDIRDIYALRNE